MSRRAFNARSMIPVIYNIYIILTHRESKLCKCYNFMKGTNTMKFVTFILLSILAVFAINYYAEVNRLILLLAVYPSCVFGVLGFCAWIERQ